MIPFSGFGKLLILVGVILIVIGAAIVVVDRVPWLGRLPGDIYIERRHFTFFFPITTSILVSAILSLLLYIVSRR
jgi:DUF2905 family protein